MQLAKSSQKQIYDQHSFVFSIPHAIVAMILRIAIPQFRSNRSLKNNNLSHFNISRGHSKPSSFDLKLDVDARTKIGINWMRRKFDFCTRFVILRSGRFCKACCCCCSRASKCVNPLKYVFVFFRRQVFQIEDFF